MHAKPFFDRLQSFVKICMSPEKHYQKDEWLLKVKTDTSIIMIFIAAVTLFSLSISNFYHHENFLASVELIITLVLLPALYLLRNKKSSYNPISFLFFITWFIILMIHFTITSNNEINILWFVSFFVTVFFLRDKREGMIWLLITLTYLSTVFLFSKQDHPLSDYVIMIVNILFISLILFWYEVLKQKDTEHLLQHNDHLEDEIALHTVDLKDAKIKADEQNLAKSEFLANMSHEIRTPLNAIQGFIQLLQEQEDQPQKRKYLKTIKQSSDTLLEIINDILDISKIESNKLDITHTDFDSHELFNSIKDLFHARSLEKNIFFHVALDPELPLYLFSDPLRLRQIITNLLSNALKFTPANGSINFRVTYDRGNLTLSVKDNGIGIPKDRQKKIFEQFSQADGSTTYVYGGTGLGLTISSKLVQLLQGELKVSSQVGLGSEFYFTIPVTKGKKPEKLEGSTLTMPQRFQAKVLLVEDNDANQLFMSALFDSFGITYETAIDGLEAIMLYKLNSYDLIFMDENMPNMNGVQATLRIREHEKAQRLKPTPIIALTANALKDSKQEFCDAGIDFHLTKPVTKEDLHKVFNQYLLGSKQNLDIIIPSEPKMTQTNQALLQKAEEIGIDLDTLKEILILFFEKLPLQITEMRQAFTNSDYTQLHVISHTIKGTAANLFYHEISEIASQIEQLSIAKNCADCGQLFEQLLEKLGDAQKAIVF